MNAKWHVPPAQPRSKQRESQVAKFFASDAGLDAAEDLAREGFQNSQDVRVDPGQPVRVRIAFGMIAAAAAEPYRRGLAPHLAAVRAEMPSVDAVAGDCPFLTFEDFNTTGLTGDTAQERRYADQAPNAFHAFFRAEGKTDKVQGQRGSHGVGKVAFMAPSAAHAVFALTERETDHRQLVFGTGVLQSHRVGTTDFDADAWFGLDAGDVLQPEEQDASAIERFRSDFALARKPGEAGLSVVVPWLDAEEVTTARVTDAVLRGHAYPVLAGDLVVEIVETPGATPLLIDRTNFLAVLATRDEQLEAKVRPASELIAWLLANPPTRTLGMHKATAPAWDDPDLLSGELAAAVREELDAGQNVALRVPVRVRSKRGEALESFFDIALRRDDSATGRRPSVQFLRHGLLISGMGKPVPGYQAIVRAEDPGLADFLRAAENPSHTKWDAKPLRDRYTYNAGTLAYVVESVGRLARLLTPPGGLDESLLGDIFSVDDPRRRGRKSGGRKAGRGVEPRTPVPPPPGPIPVNPKWWRVERSAGGFSIRPNASPDAAWPRALGVAVAYDLADGGNALGAWSPFDFVFSKGRPASVRLGGKGVSATLGAKENRLVLTIAGPDFVFRADGFETRRGDLVVRTLDVTATVDGDVEDVGLPLGDVGDADGGNAS